MWAYSFLEMREHVQLSPKIVQHVSEVNFTNEIVFGGDSKRLFPAEVRFVGMEANFSAH